MSAVVMNGSVDKENISIDPSSSYTGQGEKIVCGTPTTPSTIAPPVFFDGTILHSGMLTHSFDI